MSRQSERSGIRQQWTSAVWSAHIAGVFTFACCTHAEHSEVDCCGGENAAIAARESRHGSDPDDRAS